MCPIGGVVVQGSQGVGLNMATLSHYITTGAHVAEKAGLVLDTSRLKYSMSSIYSLSTSLIKP